MLLVLCCKSNMSGCSMCFLFLSLHSFSRWRSTCPSAHLRVSAPRPGDIWNHGSQFQGEMDSRTGPGGEVPRGVLPGQRRTAWWKSIRIIEFLWIINTLMKMIHDSWPSYFLHLVVNSYKWSQFYSYSAVVNNTSSFCWSCLTSFKRIESACYWAFNVFLSLLISDKGGFLFVTLIGWTCSWFPSRERMER